VDDCPSSYSQNKKNKKKWHKECAKTLSINMKSKNEMGQNVQLGAK
jgi:hypothetical protein